MGSLLREKMQNFENLIQYSAVFKIPDESGLLIEDYPKKEIQITVKELKEISKCDEGKLESLQFGGKKFQYHGNKENMTRFTDGQSYVTISNIFNNYILIVIGRNGSSEQQCDDAMNVLKSICLRS